MGILRCWLYRFRNDNDVAHGLSVRLKGSGGAFIAIGKDHLQEDQDRHEETAQIDADLEVTNLQPAGVGVVAENKLKYHTSRKQPGDAKEE